MKTTLICWAKVETDTRDTASSTASFNLAKPCRNVAALARQIDQGGQDEIDRLVTAGAITPAVYNRPATRVGRGFGVTIQYGEFRAKGSKVRTIRA